MKKAKFIEAFEKCGETFSVIAQIPDCPEKAHALARITEAGMWVRMALDIEMSPEPTVELKPREVKAHE